MLLTVGSLQKQRSGDYKVCRNNVGETAEYTETWGRTSGVNCTLLLIVACLTFLQHEKLRWYGHVTRATGLANTIMQGTVPGGRRRGRPKKKKKKCWHDNIKEWTEQPLAKTLRLAEDRDGWRKIIKTSVVPLQPPPLSPPPPQRQGAADADDDDNVPAT